MKAALAAVVALIPAPAVAQVGFPVPYSCQDGRQVEVVLVPFVGAQVVVLRIDQGEPVLLNATESTDRMEFGGAGLRWSTTGIDGEATLLGPATADEQAGPKLTVSRKPEPRGVGWVLYPPGTLDD